MAAWLKKNIDCFPLMKRLILQLLLDINEIALYLILPDCQRVTSVASAY